MAANNTNFYLTVLEVGILRGPHLAKTSRAAFLSGGSGEDTFLLFPDVGVCPRALARVVLPRLQSQHQSISATFFHSTISLSLQFFHSPRTSFQFGGKIAPDESARSIQTGIIIRKQNPGFLSPCQLLDFPSSAVRQPHRLGGTDLRRSFDHRNQCRKSTDWALSKWECSSLLYYHFHNRQYQCYICIWKKWLAENQNFKCNF